MPEGAKFYVYEDKASKWRWQLVGADDSDILGDSGQGYATEHGCRQMLAWIRANASSIPVYAGKLG
jgi:uncharacterized protein YegP (UPF0339 family)